MNIGLKENFINALKDYKYLLNRGYPGKASLDIVVQRYSLNKVERMVLYRCIHSNSIAKLIRKKIVSSNYVKGKLMLIDGFNVLITIDTALSCNQVFLSDDGIIRDVSKSIKKFEFKTQTHNTLLDLMLKEIKNLAPRYMIIFYDKQVSFSGQVASLTRRHAETIIKDTVKWDVFVSDRNDKTIIMYSSKGIVSTSDIVILLKSKEIFDLAQHIVRKKCGKKIIDLNVFLENNI